jgi:hypothetical protein
MAISPAKNIGRLAPKQKSASLGLSSALLTAKSMMPAARNSIALIRLFFFIFTNIAVLVAVCLVNKFLPLIFHRYNIIFFAANSVFLQPLKIEV